MPVGGDDPSLLSSAAQRLGRTLVVMTTTTRSTSSDGHEAQSRKNTNDDQRQQKCLGLLCHQLLQLLTLVFPVATTPPRNNNNNNNNEGTNEHKMSNSIGIPPRSMAVIQCAWSVLGHVSSDMIDSHIIRPWRQQLFGASHGAIQKESKTTGTAVVRTTNIRNDTTRMERHHTIRQIGALCAFVPPHSEVAIQFLRRVATTTSSSSFLSVSGAEDTTDRTTTTSTTIVEQILNIAVPFPWGRTGRKRSVSLSSKSKLKSAGVSTDAEQTLLWLTQALYAGGGGGVTSNNNNNNNTEKDRVVAMWVAAISHSTGDREGDESNPNTKIQQESSPLRTLKDQHHPREGMAQFTDMVQLMTERAEFFVSHIVLILSPPPDSAVNVETKDTTTTTTTTTSSSSDVVGDPLSSPLQDFPSRIFCFLLRYYLSSGDDDTKCIETDRKNNTNNAPSSCAAFTPPSFKLISTILLPILCEKCSQEQLLFGDDNQEQSLGLLILIHEVLSTVVVASKGNYRDNTAVQDAATSCLNLENTGDVVTPVVDMVLQLDNDKEYQQEFLQSISSILLSMLIAVLELGAKLRSTEDEQLLQSFLPTLRSLSIAESRNGESASTTLQDDDTDGIAAMAVSSLSAVA